MKKDLHTSNKAPGTYTSYTIGFVLSIVLTVVAYFMVQRHASTQHVEFSHASLIAGVTALALVQLFVQLVFFLHLGNESRPRWNLLAFLFAALVVIIVVFGSLWIMKNLDYNSMSPSETNNYIEDEERIYR